MQICHIVHIIHLRILRMDTRIIQAAQYTKVTTLKKSMRVMSKTFRRNLLCLRIQAESQIELLSRTLFPTTLGMCKIISINPILESKGDPAMKSISKNKTVKAAKVATAVKEIGIIIKPSKTRGS